ncbi:MFS transporter [Embleya hyalina]|uniref:MFS transporter n=1 Tax=Embleya hyalina TaxID=516124 RepID=A0A401YKB1_9ACTN|nr:MFS transporter [Embleya hyalina]GCD95018.1 MFS transporter [Embleya hyalina]
MGATGMAGAAGTAMGAVGAGRRRWWALAALSLAMLAVGLDGTVLSVALPRLAGDLEATASDLQWFSSSYLLFLAAAMLPMGLLGDRLGHKRVLVASLSLFALSSAGCAYAATPGWFIAARSVLGVAGAGIVVMALSALTVLFPAAERPRAVGVWSAANFLALPLGPLLGGWMLTHLWWGWVFLINVPVALVGVVVVSVLVPKAVPEAVVGRRSRPDPVGVSLSTGGLVCVTLGLIRAGEYGRHDAWAWAATGGGLVLLAAFGRYEHRLGSRPGRQPLLDLRVFAAASYTWGVVLIGIAVFANIGVLFTMPQYFQAVRGTDAMGSGLRLLPIIGGLVIGAVPADRVARLLGVKVAVAVGFVLMAAGLLMGGATSVGSSAWFVALWMGLSGAGMGLAMATSTAAALSEVSQGRSGVEAAVLQAVNKVGAPFGSAILGSVSLTGYRDRLRVPDLSAADLSTARSGVFGGAEVAGRVGSAPMSASVRGAFVHGMDLALLVSGGVAVLGLIVALVFMPGVGAGRDRAGRGGVGGSASGSQPVGVDG